MTEDFLLELRSEEIPARMQEKARADLAALIETRLNALNLAFQSVESYATPRRLALIVRGVAATTTAMTEERKGPRADAPEAALAGFLRSTGLTRDQLVARDDGKGNQILFAVIERPGVAAGSVLASAVTNAIHSFAWPKSMRWGTASSSTESLRWVRPLQGIVALLGDKLVPIEVAGLKSGAATVGHRFHHPGAITIGSAADYIEKLRACHVIVDGAERRAIIAVGAKLAAGKAGLALVEDDGLLFENAGLTEWPVPLLGRFDPAFLDVPPEVIQLTARVNQKYFVCRDAAGALANAFVCVANVDAHDGGERIVQGNQKVLAARLSDARFFYETDLRVPLDDLRPKLEKIVFHEKLGTVADKVDRVAKLARWLVESDVIPLPAREGLGVGAERSEAPAAASERFPSGSAPTPDPSLAGRGEEKEKLAALAERAAHLAKADLVTGMVGEFPELQGLMGGYYAAAQGEDPQVAAAIRDHYKPVGQGDEVPTAPVTVALSLADKLDTIAAFFAINEKPTGSKDPFALRRAALGAAQILTSGQLRASLERAYAIIFLGWVEGAVRSARHNVVISLVETDFQEARVGSLQERLFDEYLEFAPVDVGHAFIERFCRWNPEAGPEILDFFADRLKVQQKEAGVRHDLIDAVFALGGEDDLVRLLARVHALQAFVGTEDGRNLLAGYKRAANILKKEAPTSSAPLPAREGLGVGAERSEAPAAASERDPAGRAPTPDPSLAGRGEIQLSYTPETEEAALIQALDSAEPRAAAAIAREDFEGAMAALAGLRAPIDAFFDKVTVNDPDPEKRAARLALLARMRDAVHQVADFTRIDG